MIHKLSFSWDSLMKAPAPFRWLVSVPVSFCWPANFWTTIRLFGLLVVIPLFSYNHYLGFLGFILCLYTDGLDGLMARYYPDKSDTRINSWLDFFFWLYVFDFITEDQYDSVGKWFDPLADKIFIISAFFYFGLWLEPVISPWLFYTMAIIEISNRGVIIPLVRKVIMKKPLHIKANKLGKMKFISESLVGFLVMFYYLWPDTLWLSSLNILMFVAIALSVGSMLGHLYPERFIKLKLLKP